MENNEYPYKGLSINGFIMLFFQLLLALLIMALILILGWIVPAAILSLIWVFLSSGYIKQEPNESRVLVFFGKYSGTYRKVGFNWINPLLTKKRISLRIRNLDVEPIKVND